MIKMLSMYISIVNKLNTFIGKLSSLLPILLVFFTVYEVIMRYVFNKPTIWAWDLNAQIYAALVLLTGGYTMLERGHISVDFLVQNLSKKKRVLLDIITAVIVLFALIIIIIYGWEVAWDSFKKKEPMSTLWAPPLYTVKLMIPIGAFLIFNQRIVLLIQDLYFLIKSKEWSENV